MTYIDPVDWFDFDCDYCTGAYDSRKQLGMFHRTWNADAPPPNPSLNVASSYNYSDNPDRIVAAGDNQVTLAWDNLSEVTPDPEDGLARLPRLPGVEGGQLAAAGGLGRAERQTTGRCWASSATSTTTTAARSSSATTSKTSETDSICPKVFVPNYSYPVGSAHCADGCVDTATVDICLNDGDLWDRQSGEVIRPTDCACVEDTDGGCDETTPAASSAGRPARCRRTRRPHPLPGGALPATWTAKSRTASSTSTR